MEVVLGTLAATWGVAMSLAPILQIRVIRSQGHSWGVSVGQWRVWSVGFALWLAYGISITDWPLIVNNAVALSMGLTTLVFIVRYRARTPEPGDRAAP